MVNVSAQGEIRQRIRQMIRRVMAQGRVHMRTTYPDVSRGIELLSALYFLMWSSIFFLGDGDTLLSNPVYRFLALGPPELFWSVSTLVCAALQSAGLAFDYLPFRLLAASLAVLAYGVMAVALFLGNPIGLLWGANFVFMIGNLWSLRRIH